MWEQVEIDSVAADVFEPPQRRSSGALIYLHGHGGERIGDQPGFVEQFTKFGLPVVAPRGGKAWWLNRPHASFEHELTAFEFVRQRVVEFVRSRWDVSPPCIGLLGVSMGGQGALQLAYRHARQFPCVAAIAPAIDFHTIHGRGFEIDDLFESPEAARQETAILHLHPLNWPRHQFLACDPADANWFDGTERLASKLSSSGVPYESDLESTQGGHNWTYFNRMAAVAVPFLNRSLLDAANPLPRAKS
ncbi:MAG: hypothetical protein KDA58_01555 [Planctomycetaceae bacterium]|nr:hypothetical protein [Planctomycetaceae bacterium]